MSNLFASQCITFISHFRLVIASIGNGQEDQVFAFGREGCRSGSYHGRSTSPLGSSLLAVVPFLKTDLYCYFFNGGSRRLKIKKQWAEQAVEKAVARLSCKWGNFHSPLKMINKLLLFGCSQLQYTNSRTILPASKSIQNSIGGNSQYPTIHYLTVISGDAIFSVQPGGFEKIQVQRSLRSRSTKTIGSNE